MKTKLTAHLSNLTEKTYSTVFRNVWGDIKQILTVFTRAMVKTMTPSVIPGAVYFPSASPVGKIERSGDHLGSHSFNHSTRSSQDLYTITAKYVPL